MKEVQLQSTTRQGHVRNHVSYAAAVLSSAETPDKTKATIKTETDVKTEASLTAVTPDTVASSTVTTNDSIACAAPDKKMESTEKRSRAQMKEPGRGLHTMVDFLNVC